MFKKFKIKLSFLFTSLFMLLFLSCHTSKPTINQVDVDALNTLLNSRQFHIESHMAYPQVTMAMQQVLSAGVLGPGNMAGSISLIGNENFLKISGDSITSYLPYFGERQMQVNYGGRDTGIEFKGIVKNYKTEKNNDHSYTVSFEAQSNSENFNVILRLFPNLNSDITLSGNARSPIRYSGFVAPIAK